MNPADWIGRPIADVDGEPYGTLDELFVGKTTGEPEFAFVSVAGKRVAVPLRNARRADDVVILPLSPDLVREAPAVQRDVTSIPAAAGERVLEFFGLNGPSVAAPTAPTAPMSPSAPAPAPVAESDEVEVTRSEEELVVDKASYPTERVRLHKTIVEEEVTLTVTLRREELRVEREPLSDVDADAIPDQGNGDAQLTDDELVFVLYAEQPVVQKRVVPVERVKVARDTIVEHARLTDQVRKERVEVDTTPTPQETNHR
ncbi:MAG: hypothetical protein AVDCRST_MAG85-2342 [uncultured Solirubrobacteraceae bacterium]|uniref:DUF2382 domain-containing protein n=1 Tax=uncultured Solirubrobacteraceae bacterium TaxID=1162706 RepID=A0A6J4T1Y2_9ACTN|nr:MAG: hypothetical protein AVDCRST_MAG85-2342 [uncultured Solirubrobacteraceae bacterium]